MNVIPTEVLDVYILEPKVFGDHRGWFMETWSTRNMEEAGLHYNFVQDNQSYSAQKGTLRSDTYFVSYCTDGLIARRRTGVHTT